MTQTDVTFCHNALKCLITKGLFCHSVSGRRLMAHVLPGMINSTSMPILDNPKYEVFAQEYFKTRNATQSACRAGFSEKSAHVQGSKLSHHRLIVARVKEIGERVSDNVVADLSITKEWVLVRLTRLYDIAETKQQVTPATRCLELIGKEIGMFQDVIPRELFTVMMSLMGAAVARHVQDATALEHIMQDWERINTAEPRQLKAGMVAEDRQSISPSDTGVA